MSRTTQKATRQAQKNNLPLPLIAGVAVVVIAVAALIIIPQLNKPSASTGDVVNTKINAQQYNEQFTNKDHFLLDVRTPAEFAGGHIKGAANIAVETLSSQLSQVPKDKPVVLYCRSGNRSAQAASILQQAGYTKIYDLGGISDWAAAGYPVVQ